MDHFHKARKAIQDGLIGQVVWASGGWPNKNKKGEWNYTIDPEGMKRTSTGKHFRARHRNGRTILKDISDGASTGIIREE
jgi:hypothetical protein